MVLVLAVALMLATGAVAAGAWRSSRSLERSEALLLRGELGLVERRRIAQGQAQLAELQRLAEISVEGGTRAVQLVHYGVAAIPFGILEAIPPTRGPARVVRATHDLIAGAVYGAISLGNRGVGRLVRRNARRP